MKTTTSQVCLVVGIELVNTTFFILHLLIYCAGVSQINMFFEVRIFQIIYTKFRKLVEMMKVFSLLVAGVAGVSQKVEVNGLIKDVNNTDHLFNPISVTDKNTLNYYHLARAFKLEHDTSVVLCVRGSKNYQVVEEWNQPLPSHDVVKIKMFQVGKKYEFQFEDDACTSSPWVRTSPSSVISTRILGTGMNTRRLWTSQPLPSSPAPSFL